MKETISLENFIKFFINSDPNRIQTKIITPKLTPNQILTQTLTQTLMLTLNKGNKKNAPINILHFRFTFFNLKYFRVK